MELKYIIEENEDSLELYIALPDVAADEVKVNINSGILTLDVDTESMFIPKDRYLFVLPFEVESTENAVLEYGVLYIKLDKVITTIKVEGK